MNNLSRHTVAVSNGLMHTGNSLDKNIVSVVKDSTISSFSIIKTSLILPFLSSSFNLFEALSTQCETSSDACVVNSSAAQKTVISINVHISKVVSDSFSLLQKCDYSFSDQLYFRIDNLEDRGWIFDVQRALSFRVTIYGISYEINNGLQVASPRLQHNSRTRREHLSVGRMTCVLNQHFNL